jgi:hypothetical protein
LAAWPQPVCGPKASPSRLRVAALPRPDGFPCQDPLPAWTGTSIPRRCLASCVPPSLQTPPRRNRTINLLSIAYASRPRLRCRLTLGGLTFPRNPWAFGEPVFHRLSRYSCRDSRFRPVQPSSRSTFPPNGMLPYRARGLPLAPAASVVDLSPVELSAQHRLTSELLRTL